MRDRLIELLNADMSGCDGDYAEEMADQLLANGVIVPPCKVGDTVYYINVNSLNLWVKPNTIYEADVVRIVTTKLGTSLVIQIHNEYGCTEIPNIKDFGKTVFLTREEAEQKLESMRKE